MQDPKDIELLHVGGANYATFTTRKYKLRKRYAPKDLSRIEAFIPGLIREVKVKAGQHVARGEKLVVLEAMKMKNDVVSPRDGVVRGIAVKPGDIVSKNQLLLELEP